MTATKTTCRLSPGSERKRLQCRFSDEVPPVARTSGLRVDQFNRVRVTKPPEILSAISLLQIETKLVVQPRSMRLLDEKEGGEVLLSSWYFTGILMVKMRDWRANIKAEGRLHVAHNAVATARPDLQAYRDATSAAFPMIVDGLVSIIGRKLTAYIASIKDARAIDRWREHGTSQKDVEQRLRLAYHVATMLSRSDSNAVVQAWLIGLNPELNDEVPVRLLREGDLEVDGKRVLSAARAFVAGG